MTQVKNIILWLQKLSRLRANYMACMLLAAITVVDGLPSSCSSKLTRLSRKHANKLRDLCIKCDEISRSKIYPTPCIFRWFSGLQMQTNPPSPRFDPRFSYFSAWWIANSGLGVPVSLGTASLKIPVVPWPMSRFLSSARSPSICTPIPLV